ncbi:MAG: SsrA-binding protein SmpB [Dehalococcoidia bacterium]|nr:SsrA-binding protein SmpB [Dehalococcoidia bacterium]
MGTDKTLVTNRRARHDYDIDETLETGIVLTGTEIKSLRAGKANIAQSYAAIQDGELWLFNAHIAQYDAGNRYNHEPTRPRKLLAHRSEIRDLALRASQKRFTLVPLRLYLRKSLAKVELGLGRGKRMYDKREAMAKRATDREIERSLKTRRLH